MAVGASLSFKRTLHRSSAGISSLLCVIPKATHKRSFIFTVRLRGLPSRMGSLSAVPTVVVSSPSHRESAAGTEHSTATMHSRDFRRLTMRSANPAWRRGLQSVRPVRRVAELGSLYPQTRTGKMQLTEFSQDQIWTRDYPVKLAICPFNARMSVIRLEDGQLMLHSPCDINDATAAAISKLGQVGYIVAPGSFHHMYVTEAQRRFPNAQTYICPGIERKVPSLRFDWILGPRSPAVWSDTIDQVLIRGGVDISGKWQCCTSQVKRSCSWMR